MFLAENALTALHIFAEGRNHNTGPYPRPPHQNLTSTVDRPPEPTSTVRLPFPKYPFPSGLPRNPAYLAKGKKGGVATEHKRCSKMGVDVLKVRACMDEDHLGMNQRISSLAGWRFRC